MEKNSKIFIAGHRGLVGSAIKRNLLAKGYSNLIERPHSELDLTDQTAVADFFDKERPEYVILAAAKVGGIVANNTYRGEFIYENLQIQNNVIHQAYKHGVTKLLFLGSTCIYPKLAPQPMPEDCLLTNTLEYTNEPYAIAKIAGLKLCESYNLQYGTDFIAVMPTNLYGFNDNFDLERSHVLPAMIRKIHLAKALECSDWSSIRNDFDNLPVEGVSGIADESTIRSLLSKYGIRINTSGQVTLSLWGTGKPMREFLWSDDMAEACVFLLEKVSFQDIVSKQFPDRIGEIRNTHLNIGTGVDLSIAQLASLIKTTVGFSGEILFDETKPDGTMKKLTDPTKINTLGWKPRVELPDGIEMLYKWYLTNEKA